MSERVEKFGLKVDAALANFIDNEAIPGTGIEKDTFWKGFTYLVSKLSKKNEHLLKTRKDLQLKIDSWHIDRRGLPFNINEYRNFLTEIGYLAPEGPDFKISTENVDKEIACISGPQLVVPVTNARYSLNAANARWGSFYDALYGADVLGRKIETPGFDIKRGNNVIEYAKKHLDNTVPLTGCVWSDITGIGIKNSQLILKSGPRIVNLKHNSQFQGYILNTNSSVSEIVFSKNNLHLRVTIDPHHPVGKIDKANISNIILESAISTIMDCEDSVATVDASDKVLAYRNWLGLMKGDLEEVILKGTKRIIRKLNPDLTIKTPKGSTTKLRARSLMLNRNVGLLMTTPAILDQQGNEIAEGLMDAICTVLIAIHDLKKTNGKRNSLTGSIYIVKPKLHGPQEVQFTNETFTLVEEILGLKQNTVKLGIMDEERRTSVNLKECIRAAEPRVAFINTGFLDRTGDEIHTSMEAGPMLKKGDMKNTLWIDSYEKRNVQIGLNCGLNGRAQIGKGMWAMPDLMKRMVKEKVNHPEAGANCAWVPSPTAATLHVMHYHLVPVNEIQIAMTKGLIIDELEHLLTIPTLDSQNLSSQEIQQEIDNNCQGILGYVVRWVDQGIGCSKVPDINDTGLMEDRATCRISSQALTNWLHHDIVKAEQVYASLKKMATVVDKQNSIDSSYSAMSPSYTSNAYLAACDLVFKGRSQPAGYTEPILHTHRLAIKANG
ncbi:MAG: malate synthase G [Paracoccaceae bacterium]